MSASVRVHPEQLRAEPGAVVEVDVMVTNLSPVVEVYRFEVLGMPGGAFFDPGEMSLLPDEDGRATGHLTVSIDAPLGEVRAAVRAVGETSGSVSAADFGLLVGERPEIEASLRPPTSQGYRTGKHSLTLTNNGTLPTSVELSGVGDTDTVTVRVPGTANIDAGESRELPVLVRTHRRPERGERFGFSVTVHHGAQTTVLPGLLQTGGRPLKPWLIGGAAGLLALLLIAFVLTRGGDGNADLTAAQSPSSTRLFLDTGVTTLPPPIEASTVPTSATTTVITFPPPVLSVAPVIPPGTAPPTVATTQAPTTTTTPPPADQRALAEQLYAAWYRDPPERTRMDALATKEVVQRLMDHHSKRGVRQAVYGKEPCGPDCEKWRLVGCEDRAVGDGVAWIDVTGTTPQTFEAVNFGACPAPPT